MLGHCSTRGGGPGCREMRRLPSVPIRAAAGMTCQSSAAYLPLVSRLIPRPAPLVPELLPPGRATCRKGARRTTPSAPVVALSEAAREVTSMTWPDASHDGDE